MQRSAEIDLYCYEDMSDIMQDALFDIAKYRTILSYISDEELLRFCVYLNLESVDPETRADLENKILGFCENENTQLNCGRVQRLLDDAGMETSGSMQTMLNRLVSACTRNIQIKSEMKMHTTGRMGEHSQLFPCLKFNGMRLDNCFNVHIVNRAPTFDHLCDENVHSNNIAAPRLQPRGPALLCSITSEKLGQILDFLKVDTSMLTTRLELQNKLRSLSCDDLDSVFDDCGIECEFEHEIMIMMISELVVTDEILKRKIEAHATNATQCKDSELFEFLKYEGLNLVF